MRLASVVSCCAASAAIFLGVTAPIANAQAPLPRCNLLLTTNCVSVAGRESGFAVDGSLVGDRTSVDRKGETNSAAGDKARPRSPYRTETRYRPTCNGGGLNGPADVLCDAATSTCPVEGDLRMWVYRRSVDTRVPGDDPPFELVSDPPYVCLDLTAADVDPALAIPGIVGRDFRRVVVLKGVAEISPRPATLVNIDTIFTTSSPASYDIPLTILGRSVVITATAAKWTWHFGDGATATTAIPGSQGRVLHEYAQSGARSAHVVIEWTGTFRVDGGPVQVVAGTATTTGAPVVVEVKQARAELIGG